MSSFDNITDILLDGNFDTLYSFLSSSLDSNDYVTAKTYATYCELSINNQDYVIIQQFYAYQMVCTIITIIIIIIIIIRCFVLFLMIV